MDSRDELQTHLIALVKEKLSPPLSDLLIKFIPQYYGTVSLDELGKREPADLYAALMSHWNLLYERKPTESKVQIYNPQYEQHGWQSKHTIIEIAHDDMPFLVDSIRMELARQKLRVHTMLHVGGMKVNRNKKHQISDIFSLACGNKDCLTEAPIYVEVDRITNPEALDALKQSLLDILSDVEVVVVDWKKILEEVYHCLELLNKQPPHLDTDEINETKDFLNWIATNHFTFLGFRRYTVTDDSGEYVLKTVPDSGLGVLRNSGTEKISKRFSDMTDDVRQLALSAQPLILAKTHTMSTVHRPVNTDSIIVKEFDKSGKVIGERRFVGLYTSAAYNRSPKDIPLLRRKVNQVMEDSNLSMTGHAGKALLNILENLPRDDLFQASTEELLALGMGIFELQDKEKTSIFVRKDIFERFISCLVYIPKERYSEALITKIKKILIDTFNGDSVTYIPSFTESIYVRVHFVVQITPHTMPEYNLKELEASVEAAGRVWEDDLSDYLREHNGEERASELISLYASGFQAGYREKTTPRTAVYDIDHIETLENESSLAMTLFRPINLPIERLRFKLFTLNHPIPLSDVLPILENMGLRVMGEEPYMIKKSDGSSCWISDFNLAHEQGEALDLDKVRTSFQEAFGSIWFQRVENDGFNRLVLSASLGWREIAVLRAYAKYFRQIGFTFSQTYIEETLSKYPEIAKQLVGLFETRFSPEKSEGREDALTSLEESLFTAIDEVTSLDEDRILRSYHSLINATLRTNHYQTDESGAPQAWLSFKLDPENIPGMPLPKPMFEIFVYSPRVEGVHLRMGKVARGGLRWSDRREDFRTEVLGLVKAQKVKNAVIVPAGAKGGFVAKCLPTGDREAFMKEGIASYQMFIRGLLDITDNIKAGEITKPKNVVCYDEDDPYLVVAADKGTATFSDYANAVSLEYGHWLGDAFASGGAVGYDHKKMGITAKGAWESVKRHFRELGLNTQTEDFTVVGIGDMMGDVFGNGMLLSEHIKLLAAFNHLHIFIDPDPDPATSFKERQRLFNLPRSGWDDYDKNLISKGGGIFSRSAKFITVSPEMKEAFGIQESRVEPNELMRYLLKSKVDLLWNGGIGTFVKGADELNVNVGDKNNDAIRINGNELACRVVGEGGNLGLTQLGRVEYSLNGGGIYTDFIDNSAGVDCSDHEVNIKILLNDVVGRGDLTEKQRNTILASMTDDVAQIVLKNNYWQTQAISIIAAQADKNLDLISRFIARLESAGRLDRNIEFLPDDKTLLERKSLGKGLTRPEISVLLAYSKTLLKEEILASEVPENSFIAQMVETTFPDSLCKDFSEQVHEHSLKREIIATQLSNAIVNNMGVTFVNRINEETGAPIETIVRAYVIAENVFNSRELWEKIELLDYKVTSDIQIEMMVHLGRLIRRATRWFLSNPCELNDIEGLIAKYKPSVIGLYKELPHLLLGASKEHLERNEAHYIESGVPQDIAIQVSSTTAMFSALDIIAGAHEHGLDVNQVAKVYFALGSALNLAWFRGIMSGQSVETHWDALAKANFRDDLDWQQRNLTIAVMTENPSSTNVEEAIELWAITHKTLVDRWHAYVLELRSTSSRDFIMFAVAIRGLLGLTQSCIQLSKQTEDVAESPKSKKKAANNSKKAKISE